MRESALVGLGLTSMSLTPGGRAETLALDAIDLALDDAGVDRSDVDGLLVNSSQGIRPDRVGVSLARHGGFGDLHLLEHMEIKGATAAAMVQRATLTIRAGLAPHGGMRLRRRPAPTRRHVRHDLCQERRYGGAPGS